MLEVTPAAGVKVPAPALKVPPVPLGLVQTPPACSPAIKLNKSIALALVSHTESDPSVPAFGAVETVTV